VSSENDKDGWIKSPHAQNRALANDEVGEAFKNEIDDLLRLFSILALLLGGN